MKRTDDDIKLAELLKKDGYQADENEWFTPRVLNRLPEKSEDLLDDMIKWPDNSDASQWFYLAVQEATNSHYYKTKENKFEKWTELRETRDWTELEK